MIPDIKMKQKMKAHHWNLNCAIRTVRTCHVCIFVNIMMSLEMIGIICDINAAFKLAFQIAVEFWLPLSIAVKLGVPIWDYIQIILCTE
jgi:hypothetical protein